MPELEAFVGVDVGGTHTDVRLIAGDREARAAELIAAAHPGLFVG